MIKKLTEDETCSGDRLEKARAVYAWVFKALQDSLQKLEDGGDTVADSKTRDLLFRQHVKQLQTVFEIEGSLDEHGGRSDSRRIDLDAARTEICKRLAQISKRGGS